MTQRESRLSRDIMTLLREQGYFVFKVHGGENMISGLPDLIVCAKGLFIGLETKMPAKRSNTSERQKLIHTRIRAAGGVASVVCTPQEALAVVGEALDRWEL